MGVVLVEGAAFEDRPQRLRLLYLLAEIALFTVRTLAVRKIAQFAAANFRIMIRTLGKQPVQELFVLGSDDRLDLCQIDKVYVQDM
ncbi:hypothetical protein Ntsu_27780 [Nocardia sp. IFM 10818]